jgi:hypothetical protein
MGHSYRRECDPSPRRLGLPWPWAGPAVVTTVVMECDMATRAPPGHRAAVVKHDRGEGGVMR